MFRGNFAGTYGGSGTVPDKLRVIWKFRMADFAVPLRGKPSRWMGTGWTGQPLVYGGYVFVGSVGGHFHCFEALTGKLVWLFVADRMFKGSPCLYKNRIYVPNVDNHIRCLDAATGKLVQAESDDTFSFTLNFAMGGTATMIASFAATPARGTRIVVMGDEGTLIAEQAGPNPTHDGVVIGSRRGEPLVHMPTPEHVTLPADDRDHRLMAFRMLVRDFTKGIGEGTSPPPNFVDGWRCQQVLDAARESAATERTVRIA
jgi:predicted dehydrogenase